MARLVTDQSQTSRTTFTPPASSFPLLAESQCSHSNLLVVRALESLPDCGSFASAESAE